MIQRKYAIQLVLLLSLCSCSGGGGGRGGMGGMSISATTPGIIQGGDTNVAWTMTGSGFQAGATVSSDLGEVTITNTNVVSDTQITFDLSAQNTVVAGTSMLMVTNPDASDRSTSIPAVPETILLSADVQPILNSRCTTCHGGGSPSAGLSLTTGNMHGNTVGVASTQVPAMSLITAGDPDASYLVDKIEGNQTVGARMPLNASALGALNKALIRKWIEGGALDN